MLHYTHMFRQLIKNWSGFGLNFRNRVDYWLYLYTPRAKTINILYTDNITNQPRNMYTPQANPLELGTQLLDLFPSPLRAN